MAQVFEGPPGHTPGYTKKKLKTLQLNVKNLYVKLYL